VEYELSEHPLVSILIPNKDAVPVLERCLRSIREKTDYDAYEVVVIENNSQDESTFAFYERVCKEDPHVRVVYYEGGFNYARINNFGAAQARGEYLLLLNNDTEALEPGWLTRMVSLCMRPTTGIVGAKLLYPDGTVQHAGVISNQYGGPGHVNMYMDGEDAGTVETLRLMQDVTAVTGACLMTSRKVFAEVGGMDPIFEVDYNDVDFCWRVRKAGYLVVFDPSVRLYHYESVSRGFHPSSESALRFEREKGLLRQRWPERYAFADPMGNPNYSQGSPYYRLGSPAL
jgi:GT2 family glycosyltransferase